MFTALTLSLALGAPIPAPSAPIPTGIAPRVMELKADANGKVMIAVTRLEKMQGGVAPAIAKIGPGGAAVPVVPAPAMREMPVTKSVELGDVKDLVFTTADGMKVEKEVAMKRLADGATVVVTSDGKAVSPTFLKVFKDDTLVLVSPELTTPVGGVTTGGGFNGGGFGRPGVRPLPIQPGGIQIQPGVIQIQPIQGGAQILPVVVPGNADATTTTPAKQAPVK